MHHQLCHCDPRPAGTTRRALLRAGGASLAAGAWLALGLPAARAAEGGRAAEGSLQPFSLHDVRLLDGPFLHAQRMSAAYLLSLDPDRLLHTFRLNAGLRPKGEIYGGWESVDTWADIHCQGHSLGHYLSGCSLMGAATDDPRFAHKVAYVAAELAACQEAAGTGLVGAFPEGLDLLPRFIAGEPITGVPWYTMHKIMAGLHDADRLLGDATARAVGLRLADWVVEATDPLSDERFEAMLDVEHGGMNELFADLFARTGNPAYRRMAQRFSHKALLDPLSHSRDRLDGLHANTQVPKAVGFQRVFEITGAPEYGKAAEFFWRTVAELRSYATGGHGDLEHFQPVVDNAAHVFSAKASETCGIYNMLRLTQLLFMADPRAHYADFYERALINGILASQDPDSGMATYFQGARPGYMKLYHTPYDSFWCCTGTGMENHARYGEAIYFHSGDTLVVNQFIASRLDWKAKGAVLTQTTRFPETAATRLEWQLDRPVAATLRLRHPAWSPVLEVRINGETVETSHQPGGYLSLARSWQDGDTVDLQMAMSVAASELVAAPGIFALTYGPLVLAGALGSEGIAPGSDIVVNERKFGEYLDDPVEVPRLAGEPEAIAAAVRPAAAPLTFTVPDASGRPVTLKPYYRIAHERYVTYWQV